jgi:hypothetical protein
MPPEARLLGRTAEGTDAEIGGAPGVQQNHSGGCALDVQVCLRVMVPMPASLHW